MLRRTPTFFHDPNDASIAVASAPDGAPAGFAPRRLCVRCLRPSSTCWCADLVPVATTTRVVFLQHPRESRVAIGTARMAYLALARSELHRGVGFETHTRVRALAAGTTGA